MQNKRVFTAVPSPQTKSFMQADSQLFEFEKQLETALAEVARLQRLVAKQRAQAMTLFTAACVADGGRRQ